MKNLFKNFTDYGMTNNYIKVILIILEFSQLFIIVDIVYPKKTNYYFFIHFMNPFLYFNYFYHKLPLNECTDNYIKVKNISENINKDVFISILKKYFKVTQFENYICTHQNIFIYICFGIILLLIILFLILMIDIRSETFYLKQKVNKSFFSRILIQKLFALSANFIYLILKSFSLFIMIIISNYFIIPIFYFDNFNNIGFLVLASILSYLTFIGFSIFFLNYFFNCFNRKTYDKLTKSSSEISLFILKIITSLLANLRFSEKYIDFFKILIIVVFIYIIYCQYSIFLKLNVRNLTFYCLVFYLSILLDRSIVFLIEIINKNEKEEVMVEVLYEIFHVIMHIVILIFLLIVIQYKSKTNGLMKLDNINLKLFKILSNLLENILKNPLHSGNKEVNLTRLKKKILLQIRLQLIDHQMVCQENINCFICKKLNFISIGFNHSSEEELVELCRILLEYGELMKYETKIIGNKNEDDLEAFVILKIIYLLIIDKEKIHRVSYFIKSYDKASNYKFKMIMENLYEKIIYYSHDEDDKNFILQKCVELNEKYFSIINLMTQFIEVLSSRESHSVKFIVEKNEEFGKIYENILKEMKTFQDKYKFKEPSQYYKYLWCYGILFNTNYDHETYLDSPENYDILDNNFNKNSFFILKYNQIEFSWTLKKIPEIFINRFGYTHMDLLGKNYEALFPGILREYEKKRLDKMIMTDITKDAKESRIKTIMVDNEGYIRSVEISFEILPFISENNFIVCNINKFEERFKDRVLIVNDKTEIIAMSKLVSQFFGFNPEIILIYKDRINLNKLFKIIVDYKLDTFEEVNINYIHYLKHFMNTYISDSGIIIDPCFKILFEDMRKTSNKLNENQISFDILLKFNLFIKIDLKVNYFIFYLNDFIEQNTHLNNWLTANQKKFTFDYEGKFMSNNSFNDEENQAQIIENISQTNNYTQSSVSNEYFSTTNITGNIMRIPKNIKENKTNKLSNMIIILSIFLILIGVIMMIFINSSAQQLISLFDINSKLRKFYSDFFVSYIDLTLIINPLNNQNLLYSDFIDSQNKFTKAKGNNNIILNESFKGVIKANLFKISNDLFIQENQIKQLIQKNISKDFFDSVINKQTILYAQNGNIMNNFFFESIKIVINNLFTITKIETDFYPIQNIFSTPPLEMDNISILINNQISNYNFIYQKFIDIGKILEDIFYSELDYIEIKIYVILFSFLAFHFILVVLSIYQVKSFLNQVKIIFKNFNIYSKREFNFLFNKIKNVKQLVNAEVRPSEAVNLYKIEKKNLQMK